MAVYAIGDVQGCYDSLQRLLLRINYQPDDDELIFVGDLVNRGPKSLEVLRFIRSLSKVRVVLGNHDLYLLAVGYGVMEPHPKSTLDEILLAPDKVVLLDWLRQQPLFYYDADGRRAFVHAGIPPQWSIVRAVGYADEVAQVLRGQDYVTFLAQMYGDEPLLWSDDLTGYDRLRYIVNALTRMRYCTHEGVLDLLNKGEQSPVPDYKPWFDWYCGDVAICFGHWAHLQGHSGHPNCHALDTGCVYGNGLTAMEVVSGRRTTSS